MKKLLLLMLMPLLAAAEVKPFACSFRSADGWNTADWAPIRSPRFPGMLNIMAQKENCITNPVPEGISDRELLSCTQAYAGMLLKQELSGDAEISCTMSFDDRMAPLLVIAFAPAPQADGSMLLQTHHEVVIFDEGINVWRHNFDNGKPFWVLNASSRFQLKPKTEYTLTVRITTDKKAKCRRLTVLCDGRNFTYLDCHLQEKYRVGLIGCEGRNRFYDFKVKPL